jgi:hypothetical protein
MKLPILERKLPKTANPVWKKFNQDVREFLIGTIIGKI